MKEFVARFGGKVIGTLSGLDRILFRGILRSIVHTTALEVFLRYRHVLLKEFGGWAQQMSEQIRSASEQTARTHQRPFRYLASSAASKEALAVQLLQAQPIEEGLICVLSCVEPCLSYEIHRSAEHQRLELRQALRKCLHLYHYYLDPDFGFMHARVQSWIPFSVQICCNGREWLARQLQRAGIASRRQDNCFVWIEDFPAAQRLCEAQLRTAWPRALDRIRARAHPAHSELFPEPFMNYYWTVPQMEWATDLAFDRPAALAALYPALTHHAITQFSCMDILRFFDHQAPNRFRGEASSDYQVRREGLRVKHRVGVNSVKMYDKKGSVLRVETTIHDPRALKAFRRPEGKPGGTLAWRPMRKGVADLKRMTVCAQRVNDRYLDALAALEEHTPVHRLVGRVCQPTQLGGRRVRALRPWTAPDLVLLRAIQRGEFAVGGFRNADLRRHLYGADGECPPEEIRRRRARVSRLIRMLRAHKLVTRLRQSHRYQVTPRGRLIVTALLAAHDADLSLLIKAAA